MRDYLQGKNVFHVLNVACQSGLLHDYGQPEKVAARCNSGLLLWPTSL
jgi:hypothetical protein